jgi:hypothetical protein
MEENILALLFLSETYQLLRIVEHSATATKSSFFAAGVRLKQTSPDRPSLSKSILAIAWGVHGCGSGRESAALHRR